MSEHINTEVFRVAAVALVKNARIGPNREKDVSLECAVSIANIIEWTTQKIAECFELEYSDESDRSAQIDETDTGESRSEDSDSR